MRTCKDVATAIGQDDLRTVPWWRGLALRLHLLMCPHCRRYAAQIPSHRHGGPTPVPGARRRPEGPRAAQRDDPQSARAHVTLSGVDLRAGGTP